MNDFQEIKDIVDSYKFTVVSLVLVIAFLFALFAATVTYIVLVQVPDVVQTAMADYFSDYEVLP